ncbi:hypothetical protein Pmani_030814 [Petrolisthes manimaculis]|uniref:Uncharacterized protein n=1 Tax=Petrolisthes manimaculis TaxID=1843537 RepID=A0AAE1NWK1_9EUCA|nr:hypothetical protein Pmani_030814 [Petrolisthes manimaculis]
MLPTTLHPTTPHPTTLYPIILQSSTLHPTTLHPTTLHSTTLHYHQIHPLVPPLYAQEDATTLCTQECEKNQIRRKSAQIPKGGDGPASPHTKEKNKHY